MLYSTVKLVYSDVFIEANVWVEVSQCFLLSCGASHTIGSGASNPQGHFLASQQQENCVSSEPHENYVAFHPQEHCRALTYIGGLSPTGAMWGYSPVCVASHLEDHREPFTHMCGLSPTGTL